MLLTVGMATHEDFEGVWMTIQSVRLHHPEALSRLEFVVVDNSPGSHHGELVRDLLIKIENHNKPRGWPLPKYAPFSEYTSTSRPRDMVFENASGNAVLVLDCHVILPVGAVTKLIRYWEDNPESNDIVSGPILTEGGDVLATHYNDQWRAEMWGTWGTAWKHDEDELIVSTIQQKGKRGETVKVVRLPSGESVDVPGVSGSPWPGHEARLERAGFHALVGEDEEPFEIPGMGLGLFSMRRKAWPGFNPHHRGFGGEELYVHEKVRRRSGKAVCLPWLRWLHRFGRAGGARYTLSAEHKVRNYVLELSELDMDLALVHDHFVRDLKRMPESRWKKLIENPVEFQPRENSRKKNSNPSFDAANLDTIFEFTKNKKRDLEQHADTIKDFSSKVSSVITFVKRAEWDAFILAGRPDKLVSHNTEAGSDLIKALHDVTGRTETRPGAKRRVKEYRSTKQSSLDAPPEECDMLVIDTEHHADRLSMELDRHAPKVRHWIMLRGTGTFGEKAEGSNGPGLLVAARDFMSKHPEWKRIFQDDRQYGLTVLSRNPAERTIDRGPGTELHRIFDELGVEMQVGCACRQRIKQMDAWGPAGCREHFSEIVEELQKDRDKYSWGTQMKAAFKSISSGLALRISPANPIPGLVKEAIKRAEASDRKWEEEQKRKRRKKQ